MGKQKAKFYNILFKIIYYAVNYFVKIYNKIVHYFVEKQSGRPRMKEHRNIVNCNKEN